MPAHLREQREKDASTSSLSAHIPGTHLFLPAPTCQYAAIKATAQRQLVGDALIYVMLTVAEANLKVEARTIEWQHFNARFKNQGLMFL